MALNVRNRRTEDIHAVDQIEDLSAGMNAIANKISIKSAFASNLILKIAQQLDITLFQPTAKRR